ncbi:MAG: hypothetical protein NDI69_11205 [Bacteriovoracaceae bacterium]|nr:hypothetical protein [Bacteriovoracaceae bacterium]
MKTLLYLVLFLSFTSQASIVGISTHPLSDEGRVLSAEMTGYMSERNEMGAGIRYTQELERYKILDFAVSGGQDSRGLTVTTGLDYELLSEDMWQPRVSLKPYLQYQRFESQTSNLIGAAPTIRKGLSFSGQEFFPYLALPAGMKIDSSTDEFVYYASTTIGVSMPFPGGNNEKVLLSLEGNKDMGSSSDYIGCLVSWVWK